MNIVKLNKDIKTVIKYYKLKYQMCDLDINFLFDKTKILYKKIKYCLEFLLINKKYLYITSCLIILKFINDDMIFNSDWSNIFKIPLFMINKIECDILKRCDYNVFQIVKTKQFSFKNYFKL